MHLIYCSIFCWTQLWGSFRSKVPGADTMQLIINTVYSLPWLVPWEHWFIYVAHLDFAAVALLLDNEWRMHDLAHLTFRLQQNELCSDAEWHNTKRQTVFADQMIQSDSHFLEMGARTNSHFCRHSNKTSADGAQKATYTELHNTSTHLLCKATVISVHGQGIRITRTLPCSAVNSRLQWCLT